MSNGWTEDVRTKVCIETHSLIVARSRVLGVNPEAIVREILEQWSREQQATLKIADALVKSKGSRGLLREP